MTPAPDIALVPPQDLPASEQRWFALILRCFMTQKAERWWMMVDRRLERMP